MTVIIDQFDVVVNDEPQSSQEGEQLLKQQVERPMSSPWPMSRDLEHAWRHRADRLARLVAY